MPNDSILDLLRTNHGWDVEPSAIPHAATVERAIATWRGVAQQIGGWSQQ